MYQGRVQHRVWDVLVVRLRRVRELLQRGEQREDCERGGHRLEHLSPAHALRYRSNAAKNTIHALHHARSEYVCFITRISHVPPKRTRLSARSLQAEKSSVHRSSSSTQQCTLRTPYSPVRLCNQHIRWRILPPRSTLLRPTSKLPIKLIPFSNKFSTINKLLNRGSSRSSAGFIHLTRCCSAYSGNHPSWFIHRHSPG